MIIYEREKKTLIIPTGIGNGNIGSGDYADGFEAGKAAQKAADDRKITPTTAITQNGEYEADYGYKKVIVDVECGGDCSDEIEAAYSSGYTGGYDEGLEDGAEQQKAKLETISITNNGTYSRPDGYGTVEVQVEGGTCNLESKPFNLDGGTTFPATISPSAGYDGLSEVTVRDNGYGQTKYNDGFSDGEDNIRNNMGSAVFTQNGNYSNSSGWSSVTVNVPSSGGASNLQNKSVVLTAGTQTVVPDAGFDGMTEVDVDATDMLANEHASAFSDGYSTGAGDVKSQFTSTAVTQNGTYQMTGEFNAFSSFTVNVPSGISAASIFKTIVTGTDETVCVGFSRPSAPSGETVYGGSYERLKWFMDNYGDIAIFSFTDQEHNDEIQEGLFSHRNDQYIYYNYQGDISFPLDEIGPRWTNTGNDKFFLWGDGMNIFFYTKYEYGWETNYVVLPPENLILEVASAEAASCISIDANDVYEAGAVYGYQTGYDEGYDEGYGKGFDGTSVVYYTTESKTVMPVDENNLRAEDADGYVANVVDNSYGTCGKIVFDRKITKLVCLFRQTGNPIDVKTLYIPEGVRIIQTLLTATGNTDLHTDLTFISFPASLEYINSRSCWRSDLTTVYIPDNVTTIRSEAFADCYRLNTIHIGTGCTTIENNAFGNPNSSAATGNLQTIICEAVNAPTITSSTFANVKDGGILYVPNGRAAEYSTWMNNLPSGWTISDTL